MTFLTIFKTLFGLNPDAFTFYGGGGGGGKSTQSTQNQLDPTVCPFVEYGLQEAKGLYQTDTPQYYPYQTYIDPSQQTQQALQSAQNRALAGSPLVPAAQQQQLATIQGQNLGLNPYFANALQGAAGVATTQFQDALSNIASQSSQAGRYGSGAMGDITAKATGKAATAIGDVTSRIAQQERQNQFSAVTALPGFLSNLSGVTAGALAPSGILAGVGAQREAISGQPLQEAIRRFEYGENLPANQLAAYLSSIYGSPLGRLTGQPEMQGSSTLQNIGGLFNTVAAVPGAVRGVQAGYDFLSGLIP